jgi:hypothetical protein
MRALRYFKLEVTAVFISLIAFGFSLAIWGVARATARHEAEALRRTLCAERLRGLETRNPFVERFVRPADPCAAWELVGAGR